MDFKALLHARQEEAEEVVRQFLPRTGDLPGRAAEAVNYSMMAGGKRLRPVLLASAFRLCGGQGEAAEPFMAAIEMIHTHSLIHDDLPALDNDEFRRGKETTHIVFGEAMAILAGDALLNLAYETAAKAFEMEPGNPAVGKAFTVLAEKTGAGGMLGGQSVDVEFAGKAVTPEQLFYIYRKKTCALIEASMMVGAILAGAGDEETETVRQIAEKVGMAFQIRDDILDVTGNAEELGKDVGNDEKNSKMTYVKAFGLTQAKEDVDRYSREAVELLSKLPGENDFLKELILVLIHRNS